MGSFRFKQFEICQDRCAMKVGTDGVLLGAWASGGRHILDIGAGTGLISLMMAQRFADAEIVGIDIDAAACGQACENVAASPFSGRVEIVNAKLQDYGVGQDGSKKKFDAIVSNPPFFVNSMRNPDAKRSLARHTDSLSFRDLFLGVKRLLSDDGVFSAVIPTDLLESFSAEAYMLGFYVVRRCDVKTVERKAPKRTLVAFAKHRDGSMEYKVECMMGNDGNRSPWYAKITEDFYL